MSPIKGLTDKMPQFPNIGVLRKGGEKQKVTNKKGEEVESYGKDLTYFRFTSQLAEVTEAFKAIYGDQPRDIEVLLPYAKAEDNFQAWREAWVAGGLQHRCDGETCSVWLDGKKYNSTPKPCPGSCKPVGRLMVIVPQLKRFAYITVLTTSLHDIIQISQNLADAELKARGDLRGIPFIISRRPRMVSTPGTDGARLRREKWLLSIEPHPRWVAAMLVDLQRQAMPMIEAPAEEEEADDKTIDVDRETGEILEKPKPAPQKAPVTEQKKNGKHSDAETDAENQQRRQKFLDALARDVPIAKSLDIDTATFRVTKMDTTNEVEIQSMRLEQAIKNARKPKGKSGDLAKAAAHELNQVAHGETTEGEYRTEAAEGEYATADEVPF